MSGVRVKIERQNEVESALQRLTFGLDDARTMYDQIGGYLVLMTQRRFEEGKAPDGNPWPKSWRAIAENGQTLVNSGSLLDSITSNAWSTGVEHGSSKEYASIHQFGGVINIPAHKRELHFKTDKKGNKILKGFRKKSASNFSIRGEVGAYKVTMPKRPFIGMDDDDEYNILRIAEDYVESLI
jgi:phage virion morphogenesis protein